jgi:ParB family chromosome partitioning protein
VAKSTNGRSAAKPTRSTAAKASKTTANPAAEPAAKIELSPANGYQQLALTKLKSNPDQPRQQWNRATDEGGKTTLERLAESIKVEGILQPLIVSPIEGNGHFRIVCGDRRFRAAKIAKLKAVPCIVRADLDAKAQLELSITENLQREDLTPIDEATAIQALIKQCGYTQKQVAKRLGLSVPAVNVKLSLLKLSPELQRDVAAGDLTETQGREIARAVNKVPEAKRPQALRAVRTQVKKAKDEKLGETLSTKDVKTIAKSASASATAAKAVKPKKVKAPTAAEKAAATKFQKAIDQIATKLRGVGSAPGNATTGLRFAQVLCKTQPATADVVKQLADYFKRVQGFINEAKRERLAARSS